jgi:hypothetical protein
MNIIKPKPIELSLMSKVRLGTKLIDKRLKTGDIFFGTVEDVAKNLGIKVQVSGNYLIFTAPKNRLQLFSEKLHFSGIKFREV